MNDRADTLLVRNAKVFTGVEAETTSALVVRAGRIAWLGAEAHAEADAGRSARVIDAHGATLTPGLTDAHVHFVPWARARRQPSVHAASSAAAACRQLRTALDEVAGEAPLLGRGWDAAGWPDAPHRDALDAIAPQRPVLVHSRDFHALWVNSAALRAAGVEEDAADPPGGRFERDARGRLTGIVREHAVARFQSIEDRAAPWPEPALLEDAARALHALGIVAIHDFERDPATFDRMRALAEGPVPLRVVQQFGLEQLDGWIARGAASGAGDERFRLGALKLFADGTLGSRTAAMLEPFDDHGGLGMELIPAGELADIVRRAFAARLTVAVHAIGDRAVRNALDAFEASRAWIPSLALAPRVEHVQLATPEDLPRFAGLGVWASVQPGFVPSDADAARAAWGARLRGAYAWRSLDGLGAPLVFGSDAPVESPNPAIGLHAAVTRCTGPDGLGPPFRPEESVDLDLALRAYTFGPMRWDGRGGPLRPGAPADFVVWDRDLHATPAEALRSVGPRYTVLGGEIVYESPVTVGPRGAAPARAGAGRHSVRES